jgi:BlaI family transcriptional regulator, penicillinase repressor
LSPKPRPLTALELEIMTVLWDVGPSTVQVVQERLADKRPLAYTTVQTMLNVLHRKGKVTRTLTNRAYQYRPTVSRRKAAAQAIRDVVDRLFGGSAESLVMNLVETRQLSPEKLAALTQLLGRSRNRDTKE